MCPYTPVPCARLTVARYVLLALLVANARRKSSITHSTNARAPRYIAFKRALTASINAVTARG
ncbi:hypothetical protein GGR76_003301 [Xanthomonas translucens]|nr:hypothetical protein [Xanthomonas campestris]